MNRVIGLILPENAGANLAVVSFAQQYARLAGVSFDLLVTDAQNPAQNPEKWLDYGADHIYLASVPGLAHPSPQVIAGLCASLLADADGTSLAGPATQFGSDTSSSVAGLLSLPMLSSVCEIEDIDGQLTFQTIHSRLRQSIRVDADQAVFSVSKTAFGKPETTRKTSPVKSLSIDPSTLKVGITWRENLSTPTKPRQLAGARIVVAGGRVLGNAETFLRLIGGLAKKLEGVVGASGAAVQAGITPKEMLIGQTGQTVAPDLYIAAGISGSDQHTGGIRDSRVIVAINSNPDAAIFRMADYGLVADVHQALPELIEKL